MNVKELIDMIYDEITELSNLKDNKYPTFPKEKIKNQFVTWTENKETGFIYFELGKKAYEIKLIECGKRY